MNFTTFYLYRDNKNKETLKLIKIKLKIINDRIIHGQNMFIIQKVYNLILHKIK